MDTRDDRTAQNPFDTNKASDWLEDKLKDLLPRPLKMRNSWVLFREWINRSFDTPPETPPDQLELFAWDSISQHIVFRL